MKSSVASDQQAHRARRSRCNTHMLQLFMPVSDLTPKLAICVLRGDCGGGFGKVARCDFTNGCGQAPLNLSLFLCSTIIIVYVKIFKLCPVLYIHVAFLILVGSQRPLLPEAPSGSFIVCQDSPKPCFLAGDKRCNEQSALTVMHTIWFREHNRVAQHLKNGNPSLTSDEIFQLARKIVVSELQKITYKDYLTIIILGDTVSSLIPGYTGYKSEVDPSIPNAFATAAYRFGHSQIRHTFDRLDENYVPSTAGPLQLVDAFFNTAHVRKYGTDSIMRGQLSIPMMQVDEYYLTNRLFADDTSTPGMDLASLNIQRGRDHGLPKYTIWKQWAERECGVSSDFQHPLTQARMMQVYGDMDAIDLFVGGLAEIPLTNAKVGATFACIIAKTFAALRDGDRFFYENTDADANAFSATQRQNQKASLSRIICDNTDIQEVQHNAFLAGQSRVPCSQIPGINLDLWINTTPPSASELPNTCHVKVRRIVNTQVPALEVMRSPDEPKQY